MKVITRKILMCLVLSVILVSSSVVVSMAATTDISRNDITGMRNDAIGRMEEMSGLASFNNVAPWVTWQRDKNITYYTMTNKTVTLNASSGGKKITYYGIPYSQLFRESSLTPSPYVANTGTKNGKLSFKGVDCSSAVSFAWRKANRNAGENRPYDDEVFMKATLTDGTKKIYTTKDLLYDATSTNYYTYESRKVGIYVSLVGNYGSYDAKNAHATTTANLINKASYTSGKNYYSEVYAKLKPGDGLLRRGTDSGHARMVTDVHIEYNSNGTVNPATSTIKCIEQVSTYAEIDNNPNKLTSWRYKNYTFENLKNNAYIGIKMNKIDQN